VTLAAVSSMPVVRALLAGAIDYAGLFPPAGADMPQAVEDYLRYRESADAWALGRFVIPVSRFSEFELVRRYLLPFIGPPIPFSAVIGSGTGDDIDAIEALNRESLERGARVASVEVKAGSPDGVRAVLAALPLRWVRYIEVSPGDGLDAALDAVAVGGASAKLRTGGITEEAFPSVDAVLAFLEGVLRRKLSFKATAGLHHAMRGNYPLTYEENAPRATMHGYLNLLLASAILWTDRNVKAAREALLEEDPNSIRINGDAVMWRDQRIDGHTLTKMRAGLCHGFGSCSFTDPLAELPALGVK
jgi:hypothetical protein